MVIFLSTMDLKHTFKDMGIDRDPFPVLRIYEAKQALGGLNCLRLCIKLRVDFNGSPQSKNHRACGLHSWSEGCPEQTDSKYQSVLGIPQVGTPKSKISGKNVCKMDNIHNNVHRGARVFCGGGADNNNVA